jgi:hypothetical protein
MTIMTKEEVGAWCKEIADQINSDPILLDVFTRAYCTEEEEHMSTREELKCVVKDCANHTHQGRFVGLLCAPCHSFVSGGDGGGYSQVARNTQREWVGLTDEELHDLQIEHLDDPWANFKAIEAKLKEKNV